MATSTPADITYALLDDQVAFRDTIRQIVRERVEPRAAEIDAKAEYPWDLRRLFAEQDLLGLPFEAEYGGARPRPPVLHHPDGGGGEGRAPAPPDPVGEERRAP